jgi:hypothetical protein
VVADIPPFAVSNFPVGIVIPLFAFINPDALIVVAEIPPLADSRLPADTIIPELA